ncbi:hypothetical protein BCS42_01470 [Crenothrix sp. D3]|nr:hypothetical protein BCS42_01470 [Crenothrix sp. D3]
MTFTVILKQLPDNHRPNHFKYQCLFALNARLDEVLITDSLNSIMDELIKTNQTNAEIDTTYFVFKLEKVEDCFDESKIGRVVTTRQLIDILSGDEFVEDAAACSLLLGGITVTHHLIMQAGVIYDTGLDEVEIEWTHEAFTEHYKNSLWRINY